MRDSLKSRRNTMRSMHPQCVADVNGKDYVADGVVKCSTAMYMS